MNPSTSTRTPTSAFLLATLVIAASVRSDAAPSESEATLVASRGTGIALRTSVLAAGGGESTAALTTVRATVGQPIASTPVGTIVRVTSGYWTNSAAPAPCFGDANRDGIINFSDITSVLSNFNQSGAQPLQGDADASGVVDFTDITSVLTVFNTVCD